MACLDLEGRDVLVVGAGSVALEKVDGLLDVGARVTVVAPDVSEPSRRSLARARRGPPRATAPRTSTAAFSSSPRRRRRPSTSRCSPTPTRAGCSATSSTCRSSAASSSPPSTAQDPIAVAISTGGASPALAQRLRDDVARLDHARARRVSPRAPRAPAVGEARTSRPTRRGATSSSELVEERARMTVTLVGAGPGDPGLITVRGLERAPRAATPSSTTGSSRRSSSTRRRADALRIPRDGSRPGARSTSCSSQLGREGLDVVRLKGGDPYVFGRGGEEALALAEAGIPFEVVPGRLVDRSRARRGGHPGHAPRRLRRASRSRRDTRADGSRARLRGARRGAAGTLVLFMGLGRLARARRRSRRRGARPRTRRRR